MKRILPIPVWPGGLINCFLIKGPKKHILIDTGVPDSEQRILQYLKRHKIDQKEIVLIIVTHAHIDHFGSAARLKQLLNVPLLTHRLDNESYISGKAAVSTMKPNSAPWWLFKQLIKNQTTIPFEADIVLDGKDDYDLHPWGIEGKVIHTPGHTPGSLSVILENGEAVIMDMMSSGILLGGVLFHSRVKHPPFHDNLNELKASFEKVLMEKGACYYLGHGGPVSRDQLIRYYDNYLCR